MPDEHEKLADSPRDENSEEFGSGLDVETEKANTGTPDAGASESAAATENAHTESAPAHTEPAHSETTDTMPTDSARADSAPADSAPADSAPASRSSRGRRDFDDNRDHTAASDGDRPSTTGKRRRRRRRRRDGNEAEQTGNRRGARGGRQQQQNRGRQRRAQSASSNGAEITGTWEGVLELHPKCYGFLRDRAKNYMSQDTDPFVSSSIIEKYDLREGVLIRGEVGPGTKAQGPRLLSIESVDGRSLEDYAQIKLFDDLTPINPFEHIKLETGAKPVTMRVMDLLTPIGKGQRALIVAAPRTGKTMLLQDIAHAVSVNHPEVHLMVLLIDERPEEVTEMRRQVKGEVIASSMDREVESHIRISQLVFERAKRLAESGQEVFVLLDSITRTARAFNKWVGNSGRTQTGGLDVKAMDIPRKMFGTARRFDEGGSLTVVATALIDTGSRMDEAIFQEFKGTGNMELFLSRDLADRRIFPAIDIALSGTRREEKILDPETLEGTTLMRRSLISLNSTEAMDQLIRTLEKFPDNADFLQKIRNVL